MAVSHGLRVTRTGSAGQLNFGPVEQRFLGKAAAHQTISMLAVLPCKRRTATPVGHGSRTTLLPLACARPLRHTLDCRRCAAPAAACRVPGGRSCSPIQPRPSRRGASESSRRVRVEAPLARPPGTVAADALPAVRLPPGRLVTGRSGRGRLQVESP